MYYVWSNVVGTNWAYELMGMLLAGNAERVTKLKVSTMMEFMTPKEMDEVPSPRIMNSHCPLR